MARTDYSIAAQAPDDVSVDHTLDVDLQFIGLHSEIRIIAKNLNRICNETCGNFIHEKDIISKASPAVVGKRSESLHDSACGKSPHDCSQEFARRVLGRLRTVDDKIKFVPRVHSIFFGNMVFETRTHSQTHTCTQLLTVKLIEHTTCLI